MSYRAVLTSKQVQFGSTEITARFTDDAGVMPERYVTRSWPKTNVTQADIAAARDEIITQLVNEYNEAVAEKAKMDAFIEKAKDWLDAKVAAANEDYQTFITNSNLTDPQKELARKVSFEWKFN